MIFVTGRTYDHRHLLSVTMGGRFNAGAKRWEFISLCKEHQDMLAKTPGVIVTERPELDDYTVPLPQSPRHTPLTEQIHKKFRGDDRAWIGNFVDPNPVCHFGFSSLGAMVDYIERIPKITHTDTRRNHAWATDREEWAGTASMDEAFKLARDGWPEGIQLAEMIVERLTGDNAVQRKRKYSIAGGSVNVGRLLSGNPQHMIHRPKQPGSRVITLFCEVGMSASINAVDAILRAAIVAAVSDVLETNGFQCDIVAVDTTTEGNDRNASCYITTTLKKAGEPLNLNDVVFGLGHPSVCRRLCFAVMASDDALIDVCDSGCYGSPGNAFNKDHSTKKNEFYLKRLEKKYTGSLIGRAFDIWDDITSGIELPITINRS